MKLIDSENTIIYEANKDKCLAVYKLCFADPRDVSEEDELKYTKELKLSWRGNLKIQLDLEFKGIDSWNRPVFYSKDYELYFGSTNKLFNYNHSIEDIKYYFKLNPKDLCIFGDSFGCEPHGGEIHKKFKTNIL